MGTITNLEQMFELPGGPAAETNGRDHFLAGMFDRVAELVGYFRLELTTKTVAKPEPLAEPLVDFRSFAQALIDRGRIRKTATNPNWIGLD